MFKGLLMKKTFEVEQTEDLAPCVFPLAQQLKALVENVCFMFQTW